MMEDNKFELSNLSYIISSGLSIAASAIGGATLASSRAPIASGKISPKMQGMLIGLTAGVLDELALYTKNYDKHYLSLTGFWYPMTEPAAWLASKIPGLSFIPSPIIKLAASWTMANISDDFLDYKLRTYFAIDTYHTVLRLFDEEKIFSTAHLHTVGAHLLQNTTQGIEMLKHDAKTIMDTPFLWNYAQQTGLKLLQNSYQSYTTIKLADYTNDLLVVKLATPSSSDVRLEFSHDIAWKGAKIITLLWVANQVKKFLQTQDVLLTISQKKLLSLKIMSLLWDGDNSKKIEGANDEELNSYKIYYSVNTIYEDGSSRTSDIINSLTMNQAYLSNLQTYAPNLLLPYAMFRIAFSKMEAFFADRIFASTKEKGKLEKSLTLTQNVAFYYGQLIALRDSKTFFLKKINNLEDNIGQLEAETRFDKYLNEISSSILTSTGEYQEVLYYGYQLLHNNLAISQIPVINDAVYQMLEVIHYNADFALSSNYTLTAKHSIDKLMTILEAPYTYLLHKETAPINHLMFDNFTITLKGKELLHIPHLELELGKFYAFTGLAGCGKSSTLISIKDHLYGDIQSAGTMTYPEVDGHSPNIVFLTQSPLLLPQFLEPTLLETIYFPQTLPTDPTTLAELTKLIIQMLSAFQMRGFIPGVDTEEEMLAYIQGTHYQLSGGEASKVTMISAILQKPDILLLDETFRSLDPQSRIQIQQLIKKYLPHCLTILITHDDTISEFFDQHIHFTQGGVKVYDTPSYDFIEYPQIEEETAPYYDNTVIPE